MGIISHKYVIYICSIFLLLSFVAYATARTAPNDDIIPLYSSSLLSSSRLSGGSVKITMNSPRASIHDTRFELSGTLNWGSRQSPEVGSDDKISIELYDGYIFPYDCDITFELYSEDGELCGNAKIALPRNTASTGKIPIIWSRLPGYSDKSLRIMSIIAFRNNQSIPQPSPPLKDIISQPIGNIGYTYYPSQTNSDNSKIPLYISYPLLNQPKQHPITLTTTCHTLTRSECELLPYTLHIPQLAFNMTSIQYALYGNDQFTLKESSTTDTRLQYCYINTIHQVKAQYIRDKYTQLLYIYIEYPFYSGYSYILTCPQITIRHLVEYPDQDTYIEVSGYDSNSKIPFIATGHSIIQHVYDPYRPILTLGGASSSSSPLELLPTPHTMRKYHFITYNIIGTSSLIKPSTLLMKFSSHGIDMESIDILIYSDGYYGTTISSSSRYNDILHIDTVYDGFGGHDDDYSRQMSSFLGGGRPPVKIISKLKSDRDGNFSPINILPYITTYDNISLHIIATPRNQHDDTEVSSLPLVQYTLDLAYMIPLDDGKHTDSIYTTIINDSTVLYNSGKDYNYVIKNKDDSKKIPLSIITYESNIELVPSMIILYISSPLLHFNTNKQQEQSDILQCQFYLKDDIILLSPQRLLYNEYGQQLPLVWSYNSSETDIIIPIRYDFKCDSTLGWIYPYPAQITIRLIGHDEKSGKSIDHMLDVTYMS